MTPPVTLSTRPAAYAEVLEPALPTPVRVSAEAKAAASLQTSVGSRRRAVGVPAPRRYAQVLLVMMLLGTTFRSYWINSQHEHLEPGVWMSFVNGTGAAPEQYRVGVKLLAWWIMRHVGGGFRHSFALMDIVASTAAGLLLYRLLERSRSYRKASTVGRWMGSAVFLALFFYYLSWLPWFEKAETLPSVGLVAGLLWLWSREAEERASGSEVALRVAGLLLLTVAQALVRADIACFVNVGVFVMAVTRRFGQGLALPRVWALVTSGAGVLLSAGTQGYMMRVVYPQATYGDTPVFMLPHDIVDPLVAGPFALFLLPVLWTAYEAARKLLGTNTRAAVRSGALWETGGTAGLDKRAAAALALLLGGLLYLPLWMTLGKLDEVRIFLPFALAGVPLSTELVLRRMGRGAERQGAPGLGEARGRVLVEGLEP